jgi:two-component system phosphate regulon sensor histidine kinase PhoR
MSDLRGQPAGSKTLAILGVVVTLQVLVLALLGLEAITSNREATRQALLEEAQMQAEAALDEIGRAATSRILATVRAAERWDGAQDLEDHPLARAAYLVDRTTGEVWWIDGHHRLFVPDEKRAEEVRTYAPYEKEIRRLEGSVYSSELAQLVRQYPFRSDGVGFSEALAAVERLIERVRFDQLDSAMLSDARPNPQAVAMLALEVVTLNRDRRDLEPIDRDILVERIERAVDDLVAALPDDPASMDMRKDLAREIRGYRAARERLGNFRQTIDLALRDAGMDAQVLTLSDALVGTTPAGDGGRHIVLLLDPRVAEEIVREEVDEERLDRLGVALHVRPDDEPVSENAVARAPLGERAVRTPFRLELVRVRPLQIDVEGQAEPFLWGIIAGSGVGLAMGAVVLWRLIRREVRLARLKADFVSNLSHELKTPLTSISMFTEMLRDGRMESAEDQEEAYGVLAKESDRLQRIVARMIEVARREARTIPYEMVTGDLNRPVREAAMRLRRIVPDAGLELSLSLAPDPLPVRMDRAAIDDAVTNLLSNAWKYRRGDRARIVVRTVRTGRRSAEIVVSDDGVGIPRHERRKVFEMFYRAEAYLHRSVPGTGLGLALVRTIVRAHRARIHAEPGPGGVGTTFRIRFPLVRGRFSPEEAPEASPAAVAPSRKTEAGATT